MKRVVEEVTMINKQVGLLHVEGTKKATVSGGWRMCAEIIYLLLSRGKQTHLFSYIKKLQCSYQVCECVGEYVRACVFLSSFFYVHKALVSVCMCSHDYVCGD